MDLYLNLQDGMVSATNVGDLPVIAVITIPIPTHFTIAAALLESYKHLPQSAACIKITIGAA